MKYVFNLIPLFFMQFIRILVLLICLSNWARCEEIVHATRATSCAALVHQEIDCGNEQKLLEDWKTSIKDVMPWLVSLQDYRYDIPVHFCGGVIIDETTVLTTAFCVSAYHPADIKVVAGEIDMTDIDGWEQLANVEEIIIHESYSSFTRRNDIAILKISPSFTLNLKVSSIPLQKNLTRYVGEFCRTQGWGMIEKSGIIHPVLKEIELKIIPRMECRKIYPNLLTQSNLCAFVDGINVPCTGEWGGPLVCQNKELVGLTSWSNGCGDNYPVVFLKVDKFIPWIEEKGGIEISL